MTKMIKSLFLALYLSFGFSTSSKTQSLDELCSLLSSTVHLSATNQHPYGLIQKFSGWKILNDTKRIATLDLYAVNKNGSETLIISAYLIAVFKGSKCTSMNLLASI